MKKTRTFTYYTGCNNGFVLSIVCLLKKMYILSIVLLWICYWFDCLDGYYARKYKMETKIGDYYDHFRDVFVVSIIIIIITMRLQSPYKYFFIISIAISLYLLACQMGCQERNSNHKNANDTLTIFERLCPSRDFIKTTRIAGCSTVIIVLTIFTLILMMVEGERRKKE